MEVAVEVVMAAVEVVVKAKLGPALKAVAEEMEEATERRRWKRSKQP
jgi:hypothetical protein